MEGQKASSVTGWKARVIGAAALLATHTAVDTPKITHADPIPRGSSSEITQLQSADEQKNQLEIDFGVSLSVDSLNPSPWNETELANVKRILQHLPKNFYGADAEGRTVNVQATRTHNSCCYQRGNETVVSVTKANLLNPHTTAIALAHELTHRITEVPIINANGNITYENPIIPKVETLLEMSIVDLKIKSEQDIVSKEAQYKNDMQRKAFLEMYKYSLSNGGEFLAVLSENYVQGKDFFHEMYGLVLPEGKVRQLYEFTKEEFFKGQEYEIPLYKMP